MNMTLLSRTDGGSFLHECAPLASIDGSADFLPALFSGDDSRITPDPNTGLNRYFCPVVPVPGHVYASSCTASPASVRGLDEAARAFSDIVLAPLPGQGADRLVALGDEIETRLLRRFGVGSLARVLLCPSGTDGLLTATRLIAAERPNKDVTAILPSASETGTGVPMAV